MITKYWQILQPGVFITEGGGKKAKIKNQSPITLPQKNRSIHDSSTNRNIL